MRASKSLKTYLSNSSSNNLGYNYRQRKEILITSRNRLYHCVYREDSTAEKTCHNYHFFQPFHHPNTSIATTRYMSTGEFPKNKIQAMLERNNSKKVIKKKKKPSLIDLVRLHGFSFVGTYFTIWLGTFGPIYTLLDSGLIDPMVLMNIDFPWHYLGSEAIDPGQYDSAIDFVAAKMKQYKWLEPYADNVKENPRAADFAMAFVATKLTEPVRLPLALAIVPKISKWRGIDIESEIDDSDSDHDDDDGKNAITQVETVEKIENRNTNPSSDIKPP